MVVFDGYGPERELGPLSVRFAPHADDVIERLAAEHRLREPVLVVSSDVAIRGTSGQEVRKRASKSFLAELDATSHREASASRVRDRLDPETRELRSYITQILDRGRMILREQIKPEMHQSIVEVGTNPVRTVQEARAEVVHLRGRSVAAAPAATRAAYRRSHLAFYEKHHPWLAPLLRLYQRLT